MIRTVAIGLASALSLASATAARADPGERFEHGRDSHELREQARFERLRYLRMRRERMERLRRERAERWREREELRERGMWGWNR